MWKGAVFLVFFVAVVGAWGPLTHLHFVIRTLASEYQLAR